VCRVISSAHFSKFTKFFTIIESSPIRPLSSINIYNYTPSCYYKDDISVVVKVLADQDTVLFCASVMTAIQMHVS